MKSRLGDNKDELFQLNIVESFIDYHEEEFRDLKENLEAYLDAVEPVSADTSLI